MAKQKGGFIPQNAAQNKQSSKVASSINISLKEAEYLGVNEQGTKDRDIKAYVNLKYYDQHHQCFSSWEDNKLRDFSSFVTKITNTNWEEIFNSGGSTGNKTGLGYTIHKDKKKLPNKGTVDHVSEDITLFELRVNKEARVHGFRKQSAFFLVWLDKDHDIYPRK